jgi:hypothetical protein
MVEARVGVSQQKSGSSISCCLEIVPGYVTWKRKSIAFKNKEVVFISVDDIMSIDFVGMPINRGFSRVFLFHYVPTYGTNCTALFFLSSYFRIVASTLQYYLLSLG